MTKPSRIKWETGDTCSACGHDGLTFELAFHKGEEWFGFLVCAGCGARESSVCLTYQVPADVVGRIAGVRL